MVAAVRTLELGTFWLVTSVGGKVLTSNCGDRLGTDVTGR